MEQKIKETIIEFIEIYGYSPSIEDICKAVSRSKSTVYAHIVNLRDKGEIDFIDGLSRTITVKGYKLVRCE